MDTSICITRGMMREWEAVALREQLDAQTVRAPRAQSGGGEHSDRNNLLQHSAVLNWMNPFTMTYHAVSSQHSSLQPSAHLESKGVQFLWLLLLLATGK